MPAFYYRLPLAFAASLSLLAAGLVGGCSPTRVTQPDAAVAQLPEPAARQEASADANEVDTDTSVWNLLGIAKKQKVLGPETGPGVSPVLWQAVLDTLSFVEMDSTDPTSGLAMTKWYSPRNKPDERFRIAAFVKARALRSDSVVVTVERQTRSAPGQWQDAPVASDVASNLENDILERARQIHIARLRAQQ
ncbi:MAG TPA: DUF3576 domain-containing protein [Stellaceae bacterium]|nr:DUF3576 domain-containing protein [Stellaceae bacterium]